MPPITDHISTGSHQPHQASTNGINDAFRTTRGGPPSEIENHSHLQTNDTFVPGSQNGLQDLNEVMARNKQLRLMARQNGRANHNVVFGRQVPAPTDNGAVQQIGRGVVKIVAGVATSQLDSPLPGPADVVGASMVSSGVKDVGVGSLRLILPASSFQMPQDWPKPEEEDKCRRAHPLHRAITKAEKESIEFKGRFVPNPAGSAGKYFSPTRFQTIKFAASPFNWEHPVMWRATGVLPAGVPHDHINPVGEGPSIFVENSNLKNIVHVRVRERIK